VKKRNICVITGSRAEYGLLYWLLRGIRADRRLVLRLVVTGTHLSSEFGTTWRFIARDGFAIDEKVEMLLSSDSEVGISKSVGLGLISFAEAFDRLKPDIVVGLGDRFELFAAVAAAAFLRIPVAHIHGGEATEGAVDESLRHAITKMSHLHFAAAEAYRRRIIQLGEDPRRVFNVGAVGLDNIAKLPLLSRRETEKGLGLSLAPRSFLVTFHPVTLEANTAGRQFGELLAALDRVPDATLVFTKPNADAGGRVVGRLIDDYVARHAGRAAAFDSLGQRLYLSTLRHVGAMIGNSSSGLIEMPAFRKGTINIGDRQRGRLRAASVIDCPPARAAIRAALAKLESPGFRKTLAAVRNPYGTAGASRKILRVLKSYPLDGILKKSFHDLPS